MISRCSTSMKTLYIIAILVSTISGNAQSLILKKGLHRVHIKKGMYIDYQTDSGDGINKDWKNLECFCHDPDIANHLWQVDSVMEKLLLVRRPVSWNHDSLSPRDYKKRELRKKIRSGWTLLNSIYDSIWIIQQPTAYETQTVQTDSLLTIRFSRQQDCTLQDQGTPSILLTMSAISLGSMALGKHQDAKMSVLFLISGIYVTVMSVDWLRSEKVKAYSLREWTIEYSDNTNGKVFY